MKAEGYIPDVRSANALMHAAAELADVKYVLTVLWVQSSSRSMREQLPLPRYLSVCLVVCDIVQHSRRKPMGLNRAV
jgi:hypothetical protein